LVLHGVAHADLAFVGNHLVQRTALRVIAMARLIERNVTGGVGGLAPLPDAAKQNAQATAHRAVRRRAAEFLVRLLDRGREAAGLRTGATRAPVESAQLVEDRSTNAEAGVTGESGVLLRIEALGCGNQAGDAGAV